MAALYDNLETTVMTLEICFIHTFSFVDLLWRQRQVPFALDFADSRRDTALADFVYQFRHAINMTCEGCYAGTFGRCVHSTAVAEAILLRTVLWHRTPRCLPGSIPVSPTVHR